MVVAFSPSSGHRLWPSSFVPVRAVSSIPTRSLTWRSTSPNRETSHHGPALLQQFHRTHDDPDLQLSYLKVVVTVKLRRNKSSTLNWRHVDDTPGSRTTI